MDTIESIEQRHFPEGHAICMMLVIGKAVKPANPRGGQLLLADIMITNRFDKT